VAVHADALPEPVREVLVVATEAGFLVLTARACAIDCLALHSGLAASKAAAWARLTVFQIVRCLGVGGAPNTMVRVMSLS